MYLFFDTETTGLPASYDAPATDLDNWPRLVQLAWILAEEDGREIRSCEMIVRPDGYQITSGASNVHGITTQRAMEEGVAVGAVLQVFEADMHRARIVVAHNYAFDRGIVGAEYHRAGRPDPFVGRKARCTMRGTAEWCGIHGAYGPKWPRLQELHEKLFGYGFTGGHAAGADVGATFRCFFELVRRRVWILDPPDESVITINARDFTAAQWTALITPGTGEPAASHAHRLAAAIGVGCVTTRPTQSETPHQ